MKRYCWGPRFQEVREEADLYPMLHCHHQNDSCIKMGTDESLFCIVQELCESRGGRPGLSVLTSLLVSVDVKNY